MRERVEVRTDGLLPVAVDEQLAQAVQRRLVGRARASALPHCPHYTITIINIENNVYTREEKKMTPFLRNWNEYTIMFYKYTKL